MNLKKKKRAGNIIWPNQGLFYTIFTFIISFIEFLPFPLNSKWFNSKVEVEKVEREIAFGANFFFDHFPIFKVNLEIRRGTVFKINMTSEWGLYFFFTLDNVGMFPLSYQINFKTVHVLNTRIVVWIRFWRIIKDILPSIE